MRIEKKYYYIGEVAGEVGLPEYILRTWEKKFEFLSPITTNKGTRKYTRKDINLLKKIKYLVREEKYTLPGARRKLLELKNQMFDEFNEEEFRKQIRGGEIGNAVESKSRIQETVTNLNDIVDRAVFKTGKVPAEEKLFKRPRHNFHTSGNHQNAQPINLDFVFPASRKEVISDLLDILKLLR